MEEDELMPVRCPTCEGHMDYRQHKKTHMWICSECPNILFEFYDFKNIEELKEALRIEVQR